MCARAHSYHDRLLYSNSATTPRSVNSPKPGDELWPAQWPKLIARANEGAVETPPLTWPTRDAGRTRVRPPYIRARHRTALQSFTFVFFLTTSKYRQLPQEPEQGDGRPNGARPLAHRYCSWWTATTLGQQDRGGRCRGPGKAAGGGKRFPRASHKIPLDHNDHLP